MVAPTRCAIHAAGNLPGSGETRPRGEEAAHAIRSFPAGPVRWGGKRKGQEVSRRRAGLNQAGPRDFFSTGSARFISEVPLVPGREPRKFVFSRACTNNNCLWFTPRTSLMHVSLQYHQHFELGSKTEVILKHRSISTKYPFVHI
jgi:hypothetical protein